MGTIEVEPITRVVFRVWKGKDGGDVIALFPDIDEGRGLCSSYMHVQPGEPHQETDHDDHDPDHHR